MIALHYRTYLNILRIDILQPYILGLMIEGTSAYPYVCRFVCPQIQTLSVTFDVNKVNFHIW